MDFLNDKLISRFFSKVDIPDNINDCWIWNASKHSNGYGAFQLNKTSYGSHRISFLIWNKRFPEHFACHSCDNPSCVNPLHLWDGTTQQNTLDRELKGRGNQCKGSKNGLSKLTEQQVFDIRNKYATTKTTHKKLAIEFKVSKTTISFILNNKRWKHLQ